MFNEYICNYFVRRIYLTTITIVIAGLNSALEGYILMI